MNLLQKISDTVFTGATSVGTITLFGIISIESVYSMFCSSMVATAAIGKLLYDFLEYRRKVRDKSRQD